MKHDKGNHLLRLFSQLRVYEATLVHFQSFTQDYLIHSEEQKEGEERLGMMLIRTTYAKIAQRYLRFKSWW